MSKKAKTTTPATPSVPPTPTVTWTCDCCGEKENVGDICKVCGNEPLPWLCSNCGAKNPGYRLTCTFCLEGRP